MANLNDSSPIKSAAALAVSADTFETTRAIYVDASGTATLTFSDGGEVTFSALQTGLFPFCVKKFTAGTATIIGLY